MDKETKQESFLQSAIQRIPEMPDHLLIMPNCSDMREIAVRLGGKLSEVYGGYFVSRVWEQDVQDAIKAIMSRPCWVRSTAKSRERCKYRRARSPKRDQKRNICPILDPALLEGDSSGNSSEDDDEDSDFPDPDSPRDHEIEFRTAFRRRARAIKRLRRARTNNAQTEDNTDFIEVNEAQQRPGTCT